MRVLVTGATGTLGKQLVEVLAARGHEPIAMSRKPGPGRVVANVATAEGLAQAVNAADSIIHAASDPRKDPHSTDVVGTTRLASFGKPLLYVSIVGVDKGTYKYYRIKREGELALAKASDSWSVLRAPQFHDFLNMLLTMSRSVGTRLPWRSEQDAPVLAPKDWQFGPISTRDVASFIVDRLERGPSNAIEEVAGPEKLTSEQIVRSWCDARGGRPRFVPTVGSVAKGFKDGITVSTNPIATGTDTWGDYLASVSRG